MNGIRELSDAELEQIGGGNSVESESRSWSERFYRTYQLNGFGGAA